MKNKIWEKPKNERELVAWYLIAIHHRAEEEASGELGFKNDSAVNTLNCLSTHSIFKIIRLVLTEIKNKERVLYEEEKNKVSVKD
jgi:hypothetical protein